MSISKRNYLTEDELEQYADITVTDQDEMFDQISQAEELIDSYVGTQIKAVREVIMGKATGGSATSINLQTTHQNVFYKNYFIYCVLEIIGGTGAGQQTYITGSTYEGVVTTESMDTSPDSTSVYKIYQIGKFPRCGEPDEFFDSINSPFQYYKSIPEMVKRATAAQLQYMIEMGDKYFSTDKAGLQSESIGDYSYSKGSTELSNLIAPKAKMYLRGIKNRLGSIV